MVKKFVLMLLISSPIYGQPINMQKFNADSYVTAFVKERVLELQASRLEIQQKSSSFAAWKSWITGTPITPVPMSKPEEGKASKLYKNAALDMVKQLQEANPGVEWQKLTPKLEAKWEQVQQAPSLGEAIEQELQRRDVEVEAEDELLDRPRRDTTSGPYTIQSTGNIVVDGNGNSYDLCANEQLFGDCDAYKAVSTANLTGTAAFYFARTKAFAADATSPFMVDCLSKQNLADFVRRYLPQPAPYSGPLTSRFCSFIGNPTYDKHGNAQYPAIRGTVLYFLNPNQVDVSCADVSSGYVANVKTCSNDAYKKTGVIIGGVIGGLVGVGLLGCGGYFLYKKCADRPARREEARGSWNVWSKAKDPDQAAPSSSSEA